MKIYSDYDGFARIYDEHWGRHEGGKAVPRLKELFLDKLPPGARILDLCCGSGQLMQGLIEEGYEVTGIDGSAELLKIARVNAPQAESVLADARDFRLPATYDAVVSISDSLNHVMTLVELKRVFGNTHVVLKRGGILHFDLNRGCKYTHSWPGSFALVEDDCVCAVRTGVDEERRVADFIATIFERREVWERRDVTLYQTWYQETDVVAGLEEVGFRDIIVSYSNKEDPQAADKAYFVCSK